MATLDEVIRAIVRDEVRAAVAEALARGGTARVVDAGGYLSIAGAARFAAVAPGTLRRWIRTGRLPVRRAGRVYRIARAELEAFLERNGASAAVAAKARVVVGRAA